MTSTPTLIDTLLASLRKAADHNSGDVVAPAVVLWPDEKREWERLVPRLRATLPHFLTFGPYDPANRAGPAIWLRCVLAGTILVVTDDGREGTAATLVLLDAGGNVRTTPASVEPGRRGRRDQPPDRALHGRVMALSTSSIGTVAKVLA